MLDLNLILVRAKALSLFAAAVLSACAAPSSYMGISLRSETTSFELRQLVLQAKNGDKQAQLVLGSHFEVGDIVPKDWDKAETLYRKAAKTTSITQTIFIYSGRSVAIEKVAVGSEGGLMIAKEKLSSLLERKLKAPES
jgi:hypothetical protein